MFDIFSLATCAVWPASAAVRLKFLMLSFRSFLTSFMPFMPFPSLSSSLESMPLILLFCPSLIPITPLLIDIAFRLNAPLKPSVKIFLYVFDSWAAWMEVAISR